MLMVAGLSVALWLGQDRVIDLFVTAANRRLRTPVKVERIELSWWAEFPQVSLTLHGVRVAGSLPADTAALARLSQLHCAFNAWDMLTGRYRIRTLALRGGAVSVRRDKSGLPNYLILRTDSTSVGAEPVAWQVEAIRLHDVVVSYADSSLRQHHVVHARKVDASLAVKADRILLRATGPVRVERLRLGPDVYFRQRELQLATALNIDMAKQRAEIQPSHLALGRAAYTVAGNVSWAGPTQLDIRCEASRTDAQSLLALLPPRLSRSLAAYQSQGDIYFSSSIRGELSAQRSPRIEVKFGCRDASFWHPDTRQRITHVFLTGTFTNGKAATARTARLRLQHVRGQLGGRPFSGSLRYWNFQDPSIAIQAKADLDVAEMLRFYPLPAIAQGRGQLKLTLNLAGNLRQLRQNPALGAAAAAGELQLRQVSLRLRDTGLPLTGLSGGFMLRRNDVAVNDLTGRLGSSDFRINGLFRHALDWLLMPRRPLRIEAEVAARYLNVNELLQAAARAHPGRSPSNAKTSYGLVLPAGLDLSLDTRVQQLRFRRLRARNVHGMVRLHRQVLSSPGLSLTTAGGELSVRGTLDARQAALLKATTVAACRQIQLDSLFYVFEDFGQHFITSRHLRGQLTATAEADIYLGPELTPITDRLEAEVRATVRHGQLNDFAPAQKLSMLAGREQLRRLRFDELTNTLYVQSRTVYVPEMEIRSNVRRAAVIHLSGTHTFDQQVDYHLVVPLLPGLRRPVLTDEHGAATAGTGTDLLLRVYGTEDQFRVSYDRQRALARRGRAGAGATAASDPATAAEVPRTPAARLRTLAEPVKPVEKKPVVPQAGEYFDF